MESIACIDERDNYLYELGGRRSSSVNLGAGVTEANSQETAKPVEKIKVGMWTTDESQRNSYMIATAPYL